MGLLDDFVANMPDPNMVAARMGKLGPMGKPLSRFQQMKDQLFQTPQGAGLLGEGDAQAAQNQGLLGIGQSLLESSGPTTAANRVGLMQAAGRGLAAGQKSHQDALQSAIGLQSMSRQAKGDQLALESGELDLERVKRIDAGRKDIFTKYPMPKSTTGMKEWIDATLPSFTALGDDETADRLTKLRIVLEQMNQTGKQTDKIDEVIDPKTGKPAYGYITPEGASVIPGAAPYAAEGSKAAPRLVKTVGPDGKPIWSVFNPEDASFSPTDQHVPAPPSQTLPGEGERRTALLRSLAVGVAPVLDSSPAPSRKAWAANRYRAGEGLTAEEQQFFSAANTFMSTFVYETSGAQTNEAEFDRAWKTYIPEAGDKPEALEYKKQRRALLIEKLNAKAGRAGTQGMVPKKSLFPPRDQ